MELREKHEARMNESRAKYEARRDGLRAKLDANKASKKQDSAEKEGRLEGIRDQLGSLDGVSRLLGRREINDLPNILRDDERVTGHCRVCTTAARDFWSPPIGASCS